MIIAPDSALPENFSLRELETIPAGQRVVISLPTGIHLAEVILACYRQGIVAVPVPPDLSNHNLRFINDHASAAAIYNEASGLTFQGLKEPSPNEDRFIIYTSGSTGNPKGVVLTKEVVEHNSLTVADIHGFEQGRTHATCLPLFHCNALMMSLLGSVLKNSTLLLISHFEPHRYFASIEKHQADTASIVPALLDRLVHEAPQWPESLRYLISAAAPLSRNLAKRFFDLYGPRLRQGYGLTEAVNFSCLMPLLEEEDFRREYLDAHPPIGVPLPSTSLRIVDGEVQLKGPMMRCYWRNDQATSDALTTDGWLRTGDLGKRRGNYFVLIGRQKEVINRGGETLYVTDIEEEWELLGLARPFAAITVPNEVLSDEIGLWTEESDFIRLFDLLREARRRPIAIQGATPLLTTSTGKPQRGRMGAMLTSLTDEPASYQRLLAHARDVAEDLLAVTNPKDVGGQAGFILNECSRLVRHLPSVAFSPEQAQGPADEALDLLRQHWSKVAQGTVTGEDLMRFQPGLWTRLMSEWPMNSYAKLAADFLIRRDLLSGPVLELGAGVGNTTRLILNYLNDNYIRTDLNPKLLNRTQAPGKAAMYNFDEPGPYSGFKTIFAVNALHCAKNKRQTIEYIFNMLVDGGNLVIAEGKPITSREIPWALNALFGIFDGWWNRGGFVEREEWLRLLVAAGFSRWGFSILRSGHHDLGGLIWARK